MRILILAAIVFTTSLAGELLAAGVLLDRLSKGPTIDLGASGSALVRQDN